MQDEVAGRYRLEERIGSGGMAEVWRARDIRSDSTVAFKRLHPGLAFDAAARARFAREVEAARAVRHRSAVRILDAGVDGDVPWLAMEYVPGGSLADRLRDGPLTLASATAIGADVASALAAIHAIGLVHRDVTPANILLPPDGGARLGDFGIARRWDGSGADDVTLTGDLVGTLRFVAPEVLGGEAARPAADIWALGAVLYEAVTGRPPFDASSPASLLASQRTPPTLAGIDLALGPVLGRMLDPDPARRPAATAVASSLGRIAEHVSAADGDTPKIDEGTIVVASAVPSRAAGIASPGALPGPLESKLDPEAPRLEALPVRRRTRRLRSGASGHAGDGRGSRHRAPALLALGLLLLAAVVLGASTFERAGVDRGESPAPAVTVDQPAEATPAASDAPQPVEIAGGDEKDNGNSGKDKDEDQEKGKGKGNSGGNGNGKGNGD